MIDDPRSPLDILAACDPGVQEAIAAHLPTDALFALLTDPDLRAHGGQVPPDGDWATWLILAGRGFGKTFAGAAWIDARARALPRSRIALVGATLGDARAVMVEGDAGILALAATRPRFAPTRRLLTWPNGSTAQLFGAAEPDSLRGPSFHFAWGDEIAKWAHAEATLANLDLALRLGERPRRVLTTTPRPLPWLQAMAAPAAGVAVTRGRTADNAANLPRAFLDTILRDHGGTRLGRQELLGEFVADLDGALWRRDLLEACRVAAGPADGRTVIGVDPPAGGGGTADACGIVVVRLGPDGRGYVLADRTVQGRSPDGWARAVAAAAGEFAADRIVAEVNNGGAMVTTVLRTVDQALPIAPVHATAGKVARAEPVAALYEQGRVAHVGMFAALEDQMCGLIAGGGYAGPGRSPDRADALVWALTELLLGRVRRPGVRRL
ncbi:MAG: DNA-packaging protein [Sphingomonadaceae bacterium]|nr:DNA-packaging protein [Sphingomonadaceae bacterium]